jgi:signal transduction histidine kinase
MNSLSPVTTGTTSVGSHNSYVSGTFDQFDEISRALHDGMGQLLVAARLMADGTPECPPIVSSLLSDAIIELHRVCNSLAEPVHLGTSLASALEALTMRISQLPSVSCTFTAEISSGNTDERNEVHLYRIAQEAVGNSIRHGRATEISIALTRTPSSSTLVITDDGSWVPPNPNDRHRGLDNMRSRTTSMGGSFEIRAYPGRPGTRVVCRIPNHVGSNPSQVELNL